MIDKTTPRINLDERKHVEITLLNQLTGLDQNVTLERAQ